MTPALRTHQEGRRGGHSTQGKSKPERACEFTELLAEKGVWGQDKARKGCRQRLEEPVRGCRQAGTLKRKTSIQLPSKEACGIA